MAVEVHATSVVESGAVLHDGVVVGPFCYVGDGVEIGAASVLVAHATVLGPARLGAKNRIFPYAALGAEPQDRTYAGEATALEVGDDNVFREQVTVHRGTKKGGGVTRIGSRCLLMVGAHVAHDAVIDDDVVLTNLATLGGHVSVGRGAVLGGHVAIAPFTELGRLSFVAGGARVEQHVPPFVIAAGDRARVRALNSVGLRRGGVPEASRRALARAFTMIWRSNDVITRGAAAARAELGNDAFVAELVDSVMRMIKS
jgi:UDP-N-acetylglucosamine acyltransferase